MRDHAGRTEVKQLSLVGHEEVPHGFQLRTGDLEDSRWCYLQLEGTAGDLPSRARITGKNQEK